MIRSFIKKTLHNNFEVMGINERNVSLIYPNNERKYYKLADDKVLAKNILEAHAIPCSETYAVIERISAIEKGWKKVKHHKKIAIKPANGSGGGGIKIIQKTIHNEWKSSRKIIPEEDIFLHMASIIMGQYSLGSDDRVLIEKCIEPHPFFHEIYPAGVPDFRVILLNREPVMAMLRVPTDKSDGKANLHQGGLGIGIDMERGVLTYAYDGRQYFGIHPDNGNAIYGKQIPYWKEIVDASVKAATHFPLNYLGVDIAIDKDLGPLIMEVNVRPGLGIQLANKQGIKKVLKKV
ncbi:sugar-transfer associated ATP-grasp domain-containing protein [Tenacibaculum amylolyticum]|uniref:sugar-transfer associated ATP-grasp domain-containing protein n=1 Tax=Tenacibaculum amylolyticum TaxID=104269 RepID=UPI0038965D7F